MADSAMNLGHGVLAAKNEKEDTRPLIDLTGKISPHVFANQFLRRAVPGLCFRYNRLGIPFHQLGTGREHPPRHDIQPGPRN